MREIYETTPLRPQGDSIFPPGDFGETYFITQENLWSRGNRWLLIASRYLENAQEEVISLMSKA